MSDILAAWGPHCPPSTCPGLQHSVRSLLGPSPQPGPQRPGGDTWPGDKASGSMQPGWWRKMSEGGDETAHDGLLVCCDVGWCEGTEGRHYPMKLLQRVQQQETKRRQSVRRPPGEAPPAPSPWAQETWPRPSVSVSTWGLPCLRFSPYNVPSTHPRPASPTPRRPEAADQAHPRKARKGAEPAPPTLAERAMRPR